MTSRLLGDYSGGGAEGSKEPGARRKKLAGYLKAANELRQSYQASYMNSWGTRATDMDNWGGEDTPGAFPDATVVRNGEEEMIIFPSYARKHIKVKPKSEPGTIQETSGAGRDVRDTTGAGDAEFWKHQWQEYEDDNAIVDVDVRGWLYLPHRGQMTRKHRIFVGLARQLSGIPAPSANQESESTTAASSRGSSPHHSTHFERHEARVAQRDAEAASREADKILRKGEAEADAAQSGRYTEIAHDTDQDSLNNFSDDEPASSLSRHTSSREEEDPAISQRIRYRPSFNEPADMTPRELKTANEQLMARLKPFMSIPVASTPVSAFFYNEKDSRQRTINTDASGHFSLRAALDFVPTHVRVLASDKLSVTEEVTITESSGVSLISDIDDTIKHSGIGNGAREIFRNAFVRNLDDLMVEGVKEWYHRLADMGVKFHYVSNSPWQLYPVLTQYFALAGLPSGSFHLKQYSGMLQGIFEPVAERKKGTLDRLARDFPDRKFILVGDSGEADLEVYTDFVLENRNKVLGIFIRDVTTIAQKGFFDPSVGPINGNNRPANGSRTAGHQESRLSTVMNVDDQEDDPDLRAAIEASLRDMEEDNGNISEATVRRLTPEGSHPSTERRPELPPRRPTDPPAPEARQIDPPIGDLISLSSDEESLPPLPNRHLQRTMSDKYGLADLEEARGGKSKPPSVPRKPLSLRSLDRKNSSSSSRASPPPLPKPRRAVTTTQITSGEADSSRYTSSNSDSYASQARQKLSSVYNSLPAWSSTASDSPADSARAMSTSSRSISGNEEQRVSKPAPPPPPPRRAISSYPAAAASYASNRLSSVLPHTSSYETSSSSTGQGNSPSDQQQRRTSSSSTNSGGDNGNRRPSSGSVNSYYGSSNGGQQLSKREELWKRRWARAESIMRNKGVVLKTWRTGTDVMEICAELVKKAEIERKHQAEQGNGKDVRNRR